MLMCQTDVMSVSTSTPVGWHSMTYETKATWST